MASDPYIQLEGTAKFGTVGATLTEYGDQVMSLTITRSRASVAKPATFAQADEDEAAGARKATLTINFQADPTSASSFWSELWDAVDTDDAEIDFSCTLKAGTVSSTNPKWSGTIIVTSVDTGGAVGARRTQSSTYTIKAGTLAKTTTP